MDRRSHGTHVLGIESSCDDTGVAILNSNGQVLSNCLESQLSKHLRNGGIIPVIAKEYHLNSIDRVAKEAFRQSGLTCFERDIGAIAVCNRPGMMFSLQVGLNYARTLAKKYSKPLIPIHHMQAHALMPLLQNRNIRFPYMALLLSGGHCLLAIVERYNKFNLLGASHDDAPGDILDKFARRFKLKNLGYPYDGLSGGAAVEMLASQPGSDPYKYFRGSRSVPMLSSGDCQFSFSGYNSGFMKFADAFDRLWASGKLDSIKAELGHACASLQRVILIQVAKKLHRALLFYNMHWKYKNPQAFANQNHDLNLLGFHIHRPPGANSSEDSAIDVVISGGVAANKFLVDSIRDFCQNEIEPMSKIYVPSKALCSDNGLMIAWNGLMHYRDYLDGSNSGDSTLKREDSIICTSSTQMDSLGVWPICPVGSDISYQVKSANFSLAKMRNALFRIVDE